MKSTIEVLMRSPVSFLDDKGPAEEIALSTRIRLARNLQKYPFPCAASPAERQEICALVEEAAKKSAALGSARSLRIFHPAELSQLDREILQERRLASSEFIARPEGTSLLVCPHERCSVMINEEDQLRMQSIRPGFQLKEVWHEVSAMDDKFGAHLEYAFDERLGFLSSCPTNVGTGMRASVMLHLPGLVLSGQITATIQGINKLHLAVRGIFGEGSENLGNLYQISNQSTLGESEETILSHLSNVMEQLIAHEKAARRKLLAEDRYALLDLVGRSYGILRHSYKLSWPEVLKCLSGVRVGVDLGLFGTMDLRKVHELFIATGAAHLQKMSGGEESPALQEIHRAALCREHLKQLS